jgi:hypothetical protein
LHLNQHFVSPYEFYLGIGNRNDPLIFLSNYSGIHNSSDYSSHLTVRGNAPSSLQWRIEDMPVPTAVHQDHLQGKANGTTGILSLYGIDKSSLHIGTLNATYGNSLNGLVDLQLRRTDTQRKLSFTTAFHTSSGLELSIQGPISREKKGSFIMNYSYSAFNPLQYALANIASLSRFTTHPQFIPNLQDASFKLDFPSSVFDQFSLFGLVSVSHQNLYGKSPTNRPLHPLIQKDHNERFRSNYTWGGFRYKRTWGIGNQNYWRTTIAGHYFTVNHLKEKLLSRINTAPIFSQEDWQYGIHLNSVVYQEIGSKWLFRGGALIGHAGYDYYDLYYNSNNTLVYKQDWNSNRQAMQAHAQFQFMPSDNLHCNVGINMNTQLIDLKFHNLQLLPRFSMNWTVEDDHQFKLGYGMQTQALEIPLLMEQIGTEWFPNLDVEQPITHVADLVYQWNFQKHWRTTAKAYYQYHVHPLVDQTTPLLSYWQHGSIYDTWQRLQSQNLIYGPNQHTLGTSLSIEKYFDYNYYGFLTFDFVNIATEEPLVPVSFRAPQFGGAIATSLMLGKSILIGPIRKNRLRLEMKINYQQQANALAIDTAATLQADELIYDYDSGFSINLIPYFRVDLRAVFNFRPRHSESIEHQLSIELLNATNSKALAFPFYNRIDQKIQWQSQLPIFIELGYRAKF